MFRQCDKCKNLCVLFIDSLTETYYYCWKMVEETYTNYKNVSFKGKACRRVKLLCTISKLILDFNKFLPIFLKHSYTANYQFLNLRDIKNNLKQNEAFVVVDFSENYTCKYHEEASGTHFGFSKKQVSLQSGGIYFKDDENEEMFSSFVSVSDCLQHNSTAIWAHILPVYSYITLHKFIMAGSRFSI